MNWRRTFAIKAVRIVLAVVLLGFIFVTAGCSLHTERNGEQFEESGQADESGPVSYTPLTLPRTSRV